MDWWQVNSTSEQRPACETTPSSLCNNVSFKTGLWSTLTELDFCLFLTHPPFPCFPWLPELPVPHSLRFPLYLTVKEMISKDIHLTKLNVCQSKLFCFRSSSVSLVLVVTSFFTFLLSADWIQISKVDLLWDKMYWNGYFHYAD